MKDPFQAASEEQPESPPESPEPAEEEAPPPSAVDVVDDDDDEAEGAVRPQQPRLPPQHKSAAASRAAAAAKGKEDDGDGEEEEDNVNINVGTKAPANADPDKMVKMQAILAQFTEEQMSRYESFRRSGFQKSNMRRLLTSITGSQKISMPMTIVVSGIAKMFVGELVETGRTVMMERKETGPIRPCHIREAYRRLKLEGKIPRRSMPRLFR